MELIAMLFVGAVLIALGGYHMKGNLPSNRREENADETKENIRRHGFTVGLGTAIIGASVLIAGVLQIVFLAQWPLVIALVGVLVGMGLALYGQIRLIKGFLKSK